METLGVEIMFGGTLWDIPLLQLLKVNKFLGWKYKIISDTCFNLSMISYDSLYRNEAENRKKKYIKVIQNYSAKLAVVILKWT